MASIDPRDIITPDAFAVAPHLLGLPLAKPWRRAAAMLVDLLLVALLVNAGGVIFGIAAAAVFFRVSARSASGGVLRRSGRVALRTAGAVALFWTCATLWGKLRDRAADEAVEGIRTANVSGAGDQLRSALLLGVEVNALREASTEPEARVAVERTAESLRGTGMTPPEVREVLLEMSTEMADQVPVAARALRATADSLGGEPEAAPPLLSPDSLAGAYSAALSAGDSAAAAGIRPQLLSALAADTLRALQRRVDSLAALREDEDTPAPPVVVSGGDEDDGNEDGPLHLLGSVANDLGLGFGWTGLYFTAFLTLWRGQTPGKRLLGLRVIRLNGKPIGWWGAFERFGGYAAGLVTGLLGFAQIAWDRNRQAIHDKISETVVVRERR